jgi:AraC-like DNA-binding protein
MTISDQNKSKFRYSKSDRAWKFFSLVKGFCWTVDKWEGIFIVFVTKGCVKVLVNELDTYIVNSREMFLIEEDSSYTIDVIKQTQVMTCLFQPEIFLSEQTLINELVPLCRNDEESFPLLPIKKAVFSYLLLLQTYIKDNVNSAYFYELKKQEMFMLLCFYYSKGELAQFLRFIISGNVQFKEFIMNNYRRVKNVQELAVLANYSKSGFIKRFRRCFNDSPYGWMQKQRAKQILIEIKQGVKSLQEIAVEYKFSSYQHFSNFCKKQFGLPPTKIIK